MEPKSDLKPALSVIVPALRGYDTVLAALDSWEAQTCRERLEILILCPSRPQTLSLPRGQIVVETGSLLLHQARDLGIQHAKADYVVLAEDHCLPDRGWAEAVLPRLTEGWDAIGPALRSGNPNRGWTQASFLLGYGQWMAPAGSGPVPVLPGHNVVLRRGSLLELGSSLERELLVAAFLLRTLGARGLGFFLESRATMRHFDVPDCMGCLRIFYAVGLGFGAIRTQRWPWMGRALYALAIPVIGARHWFRAAVQYWRAGAQAGLNPQCLATASLLALAWAAGESAGAMMGIARVMPLLSFSEIKPVSREDVESARVYERPRIG